MARRRASRSSVVRRTAPRILRNTLEVILDNPVLGVGTGGFAAAYAALANRNGDTLTQNPHNEFLMISLSSALPGLVVLIVFVRHAMVARCPIAEALRASRGARVRADDGRCEHALVDARRPRRRTVLRLHERRAVRRLLRGSASAQVGAERDAVAAPIPARSPAGHDAAPCCAVRVGATAARCSADAGSMTSPPKSILVVSLRYFGDVLLTTPLIRALAPRLSTVRRSTCC